MSSSYSERFKAYFDREVAQAAAKSLADGAEMEFRVGEETFTFTREKGRNQILNSASTDPQLTFTLTPSAADEILSNPSEDIAQIGVAIMRRIASTDAQHRIAVRFNAGFLKLWSKGYLGVLKSGGGQFASYLASRGLSGIDAIKAVLKK